MKSDSKKCDFLYAEYDPEVEMRVVREEAREEERLYVLEMINQGLTIEEIKERLQQKEGIF